MDWRALVTSEELKECCSWTEALRFGPLPYLYSRGNEQTLFDGI